MSQKKTEVIRTKITGIIFDSQDGFIIAKTEQGINVKGNIYHQAKEIVDVDIEFEGSRENHASFGESFAFKDYRIVEHYSSFFLKNMVKGISTAMALDILQKIGSPDRLDYIIENEPKLLLNISGIGPKKIETIITSFLENRPLRAIAEFLLPHGISVNKIRAIHDFYKDKKTNAIAEIKKNPYLLVKMDNIGFKRADEIAIKMGHSPDSSFRIKSGIVYVLREHCMDKGHTYATFDELFHESMEALNIEEVYQLEKEVFDVEIKELVLEGKDALSVEGFDNLITLPSLYKAERYIEFCLRQHGKERRVAIHDDIELYIEDAEKRNGFTYGEEQKDGIRLANEDRAILYLYGLAGSGKTTVSTDIGNLYAMKYGKDSVVACALSGVAANRAKDVTGFPGYTIHSLLGYSNEGWGYNRDNKLPHSLVLLDESSMVDTILLAALFEAIDFTRTSIFMVGDPYQLDPVGPGMAYISVIKSNLCAGVGLTKVYRQSEDQVINVFATKYIRNGKVPPEYDERTYEDFSFTQVEIPNAWAVKNQSTPQEWKELREENNEKIAIAIKRIATRYKSSMDLYTEDVSRYITEFQVISPQKKGPVGVSALNTLIQSVINPYNYKEVLEVGENIIKPRDKVIHLKNLVMSVCSKEDYKPYHTRLNDIPDSIKDQKKVFNGEMGVVLTIDTENDIIAVLYPSNDIVVLYKKEHFATHKISLGWSITVHKSQGSEYRACVVVFTFSHYLLLSSKLTYTAVTRAKEMLYLVGEKAAFKKACEEVDRAKRNTLLSLFTQEEKQA